MHPGHSGIPNGVPNPCNVPTIQTVQAGSWDAPSTWSANRVPTDNDRVVINHNVDFVSVRTEKPFCVNVIAGALRFSLTTNTRFRAGTLIVLDNGALEVGSIAMPVLATATAEIVLGGLAFDPTADPEQFWGGLIVFGRVTMHGAQMTPTFARLVGEPLQGQSSVTLAVPTSWRANDELIVSDTRNLTPGQRDVNYVSQSERPRIKAISGTSVTLDRTLAFNHRGWRNSLNVLEFSPHIANLSRNVRVLSDSPTGIRAHTLYTYRAQVDIRYVEFRDLGRTTNANTAPTTNQLGRYPLHIHHVMGPVNPSNTGYQFVLLGNSIVDGRKWPLTVHNSHWGLIQDNVVAFGVGAGIVTEDGNEYLNEFRRNYVGDIWGDVNAREQDGRDGSCYWFGGFNHIVTDNVATACVDRIPSGFTPGTGFNFSVFATDYAPATHMRTPKARGLDTSIAGNYFMMNKQCQAIPLFARNEAYGAMAVGLGPWFVGTDGYNNTCPSQAQSLVEDFTAWNTWSAGFFGYPAKNFLFRRVTLLSNPGASFGCGFWGDDYKMITFRIEDARIEGWPECGLEVGEGSEGTWEIVNYRGVNAGAGLRVNRFNTPGTGAQVNARTTTITNPIINLWPGGTGFRLSKQWSGTNQTNTSTPDITRVYQYQGVSSDNFQAYFSQQGSLHGGPPPCSTTRTGIEGIVCSIPPVSGPSVPQSPQSIRVTP